MVEAMITVDEALDRIFTRIPTPLPETVPLSRAHRRVLVTPLLAKHTQPPFDASAMDGYAVRAGEIEPGKPVFMAGTSQAEFKFQAEGNRTVVTWSMSGPTKFSGKIFGLFMNCETMIGCQYEKGLANLAQVTE